MVATVRSYHPDVKRTAITVDGLVDGTAFFPGGSGLWRGAVLGGPLPIAFPEAPIMLVAHNYDSITAFERSVARKGEVTTPFWRDRLIPYLRFAEIDPAEVFFTNALMGCKPGSAVGPMPRVPGYEDECGRSFASRSRSCAPAR